MIEILWLNSTSLKKIGSNRYFLANESAVFTNGNNRPLNSMNSVTTMGTIARSKKKSNSTFKTLLG